MTNPIVIFILGIVGGGLTVHFFARAYWTKRLQTTKRTLLSQYDSDLDRAQQRYQTLEAVGQQWLKEKASLEQRIEQGKRDRTLLLTRHEAQVEQGKRDRTALQADYDTYRLEAKAQIAEQAEEGVKLAIEESKNIEAENQALQQKIEQLERNLNSSNIETHQLQEKLAQERNQLETELQSAYKCAGITFASIAEALFKNIAIQKDSAIEIDKNKDCAHAILITLRAIDDQNFQPFKKVHATDKVWFESVAPGLKMMRIYFRKSKPEQGKCQVLISHKKDPKTQSKDIAWMKDHSS